MNCSVLRDNRFLGGLFAAIIVLNSARAFTYSDTDLLLIFRRDGFSDVEFNLGPIGQYLGLAGGTSVTITNWDTVAARANFNNSFASANFTLLSATAATDANRRAWLSDGNASDLPTDISGSKWGQLRSKIDFVGVQAAANTETNNVESYIISASQPSSYSFIASDSGSLDITTLGGLAPFPVETSAPGTLRLFEIQANNATPKPASKQIGTFALSADGVLTFIAGAGAVQPPPLDPPQITSITRANGATRISLKTLLGATYRLRAAPNSGAGVSSEKVSAWTAIGTAVVGTGDVITLEDASNEDQHFYAVEAAR